MATKKVQVDPTPESPVVKPPAAKRLQDFLNKEGIEIHSDAMSNIEKIVSPDGKRITGYVIREPIIKANDK